MIDHISIAVSDVKRSKTFYDRLLAAIGVHVEMAVPASIKDSGGDSYGYGDAGKPYFWIVDGGRTEEGVHVAFSVESRAQVDAFHMAGLAAGGTDNGAPGLRLHYHPSYYAAFILDPDGINVEAVCHKPQ